MRVWFAGLGLMSMAFASLPLVASTIIVDGTYHEFAFGLATSAVSTCSVGPPCSATTNPVADTSNGGPPWTFTGPASLFVTDIGHIGDQFEVFDFGASLGTTSAITPALDGTDPCDLDIACSVTTAGYSNATFVLGNVDHSITMNVIRNAATTTGGQAVFSLSSVASVPEPGTLMLLGAGLIGMTLKFRRSKNHQT